ncbi:MAG: medium chain dehydrogenase/reductase family protein, partial [bacterium]|nr:medium chain dehydrogenase/reductase family protein [bacterium]
MQALTLTQTKSPLQLVDRAELAPAEGEVVVQVKAASLNRRDYWITQGLYPGVDPPVVLGSDAAGVVSRCGDNVDSSWLGREVIINPGFEWGDQDAFHGPNFHILGSPRDGTFAEEVSAPVTQLYDKPAYLSWSEAAAVPLAGVTAYRALFTQGNLQSGENVLITGIGGGVAGYALQYAVAAGANVWVTSSSEEKIQQAVSLGATGGFNYKEADWSKALAKTAPPNLVIDGAGGAGYAG